MTTRLNGVDLTDLDITDWFTEEIEPIDYSQLITKEEYDETFNIKSKEEPKPHKDRKNDRHAKSKGNHKVQKRRV